MESRISVGSMRNGKWDLTLGESMMIVIEMWDVLYSIVIISMRLTDLGVSNNRVKKGEGGKISMTTSSQY